MGNWLVGVALGFDMAKNELVFSDHKIGQNSTAFNMGSFCDAAL
jgi:hypothetical protein